ncbi:MAG: helix-turn-helix domain-containing protein [Beijerinckiaceae bacterium]|nr:helix-turn-helix domain-containing protein [Beijerinckiaceae bacterium]
MVDSQEILRSLQQRAEELRSGADELTRVEAAIAALQGDGPERAKRGTVKERVAAIVTATPGLRASDIAREVGTSSANIQRPLKTLLEEGRLQRDENKCWAPTGN